MKLDIDQTEKNALERALIATRNRQRDILDFSANEKATVNSVSAKESLIKDLRVTQGLIDKLELTRPDSREKIKV